MSITCVPIGRENLQKGTRGVCIHGKDHMRTEQDGSGEPKPVDTSVLNFQPTEPWKYKFLLSGILFGQVIFYFWHACAEIENYPHVGIRVYPLLCHSY